MMRTPLVGFALVALLAGCSSQEDRVPRSQQVWVPDGPEVSCITTSQIRSTNVVDDSTIQFVMSSRRMFQNNLPFPCTGLGFSRAFKHNSRTGRLCSVDTITVVRGGSGPAGPTCSLGRFQPLKPLPAPAATAAPAAQ
jgi:hypothetical protein